MDLSAFGHRLRHLRKTAGLTQSALSDKIRVTTSLIWNWEKAYEYRGRHWIPDRELVLHLIKIFAKQLTPGEAQQWAGQAGHHLSQADLQAIFPTHWAQAPIQLPPLPSFYVPRPQTEQSLLNQLDQSRTLVLVGPGGIGKTTLAASVARILASRFSDGVIWVENSASNNVIEAQNWIARSFGVTLNDYSAAERAASLRTLLHDRECLLILDDVWADPELVYLQVVNDQSCLLLTTRDAKVADLLNSPRQEISSLTSGEGLALLSAWVGYPIRAEELVVRLGGLPLALSLSGAQLREGNTTLGELLTYFDQTEVDLSLLDLDDPQSRWESLNLCFDLSYRRLKAKEQQYFAQLACFAGNLEETAVTFVWGVTHLEAVHTLRRLHRFALLERSENEYRLHPLLRDYAQQQLTVLPELTQKTYYRHAIWYIKFALYHPGIIDQSSNSILSLTGSWSEIVRAVKWACFHDYRLAAWSFLLAYKERPALFETIGEPLQQALEKSLKHSSSQAERALLAEQLAWIYFWQGQIHEAVATWTISAEDWQAIGESLAAALVYLRRAGIYLLQDEPASALVVGQKALTLIKSSYFTTSTQLKDLRTIFNFLTMVYGALVRWPEMQEVEAVAVEELALQSGDPVIEAIGLNIHRRWWTAEDLKRVQTPEAYLCVTSLTVRIFWLRRSIGQYEEAEKEIIWTNYFLKGRFTQRAATRYARRLSRKTSFVEKNQLKMVNDEAVHWWLGASETQRINWLSRMMLRYLKVDHYPHKELVKDSRAWRWIRSILGITILGNDIRYPKLASQPRSELLSIANAAMFSGYIAQNVVGKTARDLINRYLEGLAQ